MAARGKLGVWGLPGLVFVLGALFSSWAGYWLSHEFKLENTAEFNRLTENISHEIEQRFRLPIYGLHGARGVYAASEQVSRDDFRAYVASRNMKVEFPGVRGFGFIERVPHANLPQFLAATRADGAPDFQIRQLSNRGDAELLVIKYIEPLLKNLQALGLDVASEQQRRIAAEDAIQSGKPTLTGPIVLMQDNLKTAGVLLYVPIYKKPDIAGLHSKGQAALIGLLYAPIVVRELLDGMQPGVEQLVHFTLLDSEVGSQFAFYDNFEMQAIKQHANPAFQRELLIQLPGRTARIQFSSMPAFEKSLDTSAPWALGIIGWILSLALSLLFWQQMERRARAEKLAESMTSEIERLALVVKRTSNAVIITDVHRNITWVNPAFERLTGYAEQEVLGRSPALLQTKNTDRLEVRRLSDHLAAGLAYRGELLNRAKSGQEYWIDLEIQPILNENSVISGYMSIETDITERKYAQQKLETAIRDNQALLSTLNLHSIVAVTDDKALIIDVNDAFCQLCGYDRSELLGKNHSIFTSGLHQPEFWREMWLQISSGSPWHSEICNRHKNGELFWLDTTIAPFTDHAGRIVRYIAISRDITQSKKQQYVLQSARDQLKKAIEIADLATWSWNLVDDSLQWDERMYRLYAIKEEERAQPLLYRTWRSRLHPDDLPEVERQLHLALQGQSTFHPAFRIFDEQGNIRFIQAAAQVETDLSGKVVRMLGINRDITLDKQSEAVLKAAKLAADNANKAKSEFLANMSHELRTPMNALLGMMALLRRTSLTVQQLDYVHESDTAARSLLGVLNDILDFSKIEAGKMELDPLPFELDPLLQDVCLIMAANVKQKPVNLWCEIDPTLPQKLIGDALRLRQVLINLTGNAVKFTEQGDVVLKIKRLKASWPQVKIAFSVKDTGIGIDPQRRKAIFSGFTQADSSISRRYGGSGLGVAISQRFIRLMGADLDVQSTLGKGSTFSFEITLNAASQEGVSLVSEIKWPQLILLCPDDGHRDHLQQALVDLQPRLQTCLHLPALKQLLQTTPNAVVLLDWGDEQQQAVKRLKTEFPDVRWLAITSLLQRDELNMQHEVDACLVQPFTFGMLAAAIARCEQAHQSDEPKAEASTSKRLNGLRVMLVEDNVVNQKVASELLQSEGCELYCCNDGEQALAELAQLTVLPQLILMDLQMPNLDGFATTRLLKNQLRLAEIPVIAMTANAAEEDRKLCLDAGMVGHIGKPFDFEKLVSMLEPYLPAQLPQQAATTPQKKARTGDTAAKLPAIEHLRQLASIAGIDWDLTQQRLDGQLVFYLKMLPVFIRSLEQISRELGQSRPDDIVALQITCHKLKGSSAQMGLQQLADQAGQYEQQLKEQLPLSEEELQSLSRFVQSSVDALQQFSAALPSEWLID